MSPLPTEPSTTGESWEVIETARAYAAAELDRLVDSVASCSDCGHAVDSVQHYDLVHTFAFQRYMRAVGLFPSLVAEAVIRLAAARKHREDDEVPDQLAPVDADEGETADEYDEDDAAPVRPGTEPDPDGAHERSVDQANGVV
jgi:hypothetical protein